MRYNPQDKEIYITPIDECFFLLADAPKKLFLLKQKPFPDRQFIIEQHQVRKVIAFLCSQQTISGKLAMNIWQLLICQIKNEHQYYLPISLEKIPQFKPFVTLVIGYQRDIRKLNELIHYIEHDSPAPQPVSPITLKGPIKYNPDKPQKSFAIIHNLLYAALDSTNDDVLHHLERIKPLVYGPYNEMLVRQKFEQQKHEEYNMGSRQPSSTCTLT